jgi:ribonuclease R
MLAANVCSADFIGQGKHTGLFRVHEGPTPEKQEILRNYLKVMGVTQTISDHPHPSEFQKIAAATKDRPEAQQIHTMLLRSMQQAIYTPMNQGHFGLAFDAYTHFTSPIRRYPDLLVHRVIKAMLAGKRYQLPALPTPGEAHAKLSKRLASRVKPPVAGEPVKKVSVDTQAWQAAGLHCSANERRADEASRDVEAWLKCKYMREHLGEEFSGVVSSVTSFGLFVTLDAMYVEGLVHITELGGEYFRFDEARQELRGERTGIRYALGSRIQVQVSRVDLDGRRIDFRLVTGQDDVLLRAMRDKTGASDDAEAASPADKPRRSRSKAAASARAGAAPLPGAPEAKPSARKAAGKKTERKGRATTSKPSKSRR